MSLFGGIGMWVNLLKIILFTLWDFSRKLALTYRLALRSHILQTSSKLFFLLLQSTNGQSLTPKSLELLNLLGRLWFSRHWAWHLFGRIPPKFECHGTQNCDSQAFLFFTRSRSSSIAVLRLRLDSGFSLILRLGVSGFSSAQSRWLLRWSYSCVAMMPSRRALLRNETTEWFARFATCSSNIPGVFS